jgi:hypothetical protein
MITPINCQINHTKINCPLNITYTCTLIKCVCKVYIKHTAQALRKVLYPLYKACMESFTQGSVHFSLWGGE